MKVHEHQARDILSAAGVPVPEAAVATTVAGGTLRTI